MTDDIVNIGTDHICRQNISSRVHVVFHPIEALFDCYFDSRGCDDDRVEEAYGKVCRALVDVNPFQIEEIMGAVAELCMEHERTGFAGGIKTGIRLILETTE